MSRKPNLEWYYSVADKLTQSIREDCRKQSEELAAKVRREKEQNAVGLRESCWWHRGAPLISTTVLRWNNGTIRKLARAICEDDNYDAVPILADALEEAGAPAVVVEHCRNGRQHHQGCWVLCALR